MAPILVVELLHHASHNSHASERETGEKQLETRPPWACIGHPGRDMTTTQTLCTFDHRAHNGIEDGCNLQRLPTT
jgi:hypothetical protein